MASLKYKSSKDLYKLTLSWEELSLISKLVSQVRLGSDNEYSDAAESIQEAIGKFDDSISETASEDVGFDITIEDENGDIIALLSGENAVIEVYSNVGAE